MSNANLQINKDTVQVWSEEVEQGKVAGTDLGAQAVIPHTQFVTIQISKGRELRLLSLILLVKMQVKLNKFWKMWTTPEAVEDFSDSVERGKVISQNPNANGTTLFRMEA